MSALVYPENCPKCGCHLSPMPAAGTSKDFEELWNLYPVKDGKKAALRSFKASVKDKLDLHLIKVALEHYLGSKNVRSGFIKNGSTWFANWQDWVDYVDPVLPQNDSSKKVRDTIEQSDTVLERYRARGSGV